MDKTRERALARTIVRRTAKNMEPFGYALTKPTFICKEFPQLIGFFHFHKFSFAPSFQLHFGIRLLNSDFPAPHLNGPSFHNLPDYSEDDESVRNCVQKLTELLINEGLSWVEDWVAPEKLISDNRSPLSEHDKAGLKRAVEIGADPKRVALSYRLLGIKKRAD